MTTFVMIGNVEIMINADANAKKLLIKVGVMMPLFGILGHVNVNVINNIMLVKTWIM